MFTLLNTLYNDIWMSYTLYNIIKTEIVNIDTTYENCSTYDSDHCTNNTLLNLKMHHSYDDANKQNDYVLINIERNTDTEQFKLQNQAFQLNFLRSDMISWKKSKLNYTYVNEYDWEYINDPTNLPHNNYLLYLLDNMPENISYCKNSEKNGWKRADEIGFEKEACSILNTTKLGEGSHENIWIDNRLLGEKWLGVFDNVTPDDTYIDMVAPIMP
jgi:hypothetical protein